MNTLTYNEAKALFVQILPPDQCAFFETVADVFTPIQVDMHTTIRFRFTTKYGNEVDMVSDTAESELKIINIVRGIQYVPASVKAELSPYKTRDYYKPSKYVMPKHKQQ